MHSRVIIVQKIVAIKQITDKKPRAGSGLVRIDAPFPGRMSYKATKPGLALSVVYLSMFDCIVVYWGPFLCIVSFCCYVFCLLVVLIELSVLAK